MTEPVHRRLVATLAADVVSSLAQARAPAPWTGNAAYVALAEKTTYLRLRRAGLPDK
jgi:hypothetical protein